MSSWATSSESTVAFVFYIDNKDDSESSSIMNFIRERNEVGNYKIKNFIYTTQSQMPVWTNCLGMVTSPMDMELFMLPAIPKWMIPFMSNRSSICCVASAALIWLSTKVKTRLNSEEEKKVPLCCKRGNLTLMFIIIDVLTHGVLFEANWHWCLQKLNFFNLWCLIWGQFDPWSS